jgi:hypothetical protein
MAIPRSNIGSMIIQFQHENDTWRRILGFITDENINLKKRLSEILKTLNDNDSSVLDRIEYFHNCLLKDDEIIRFLYREVADQGKLLIREIYEDGELVKEVRKKQKKLRKNLEIAEQQFNKLKFEFNSYLGEILIN